MSQQENTDGRIATLDKMVTAITESKKPVLTKQDIANRLSVSWQTINNHEDELQNHPSIQKHKVGKSTAYSINQDNQAKSVDVTDIAKVIATSDKPLTEAEIAEMVGVSRPTIADRRDLMKEHPVIKHGVVGGSRAYWSINEDSNHSTELIKGEYHCPCCDGEFPKPINRSCPYCGLSLDGESTDKFG